MKPIETTYDICRCYLKDLVGVDSALLAKVDGYRRSRNLAELASCSRHFDQALHSVYDWTFLRQVEAFFKKNSAFSSSKICANSARESFMDSERRCAETNLRLDFYHANRKLLASDVSFWMTRMEHYISSVLGDFQSFLCELPRLVRVTPGATSTTRRQDSLPQLKMRMKLHATRGAVPYVKTLYRFFGFGQPRVVTVETNRVELVPKNWKTDRTIACEPEGNLPFQLAFDGYAKSRLRRRGIDLSNQGANKCMAQHASVCDDYVTVDFSAASDTISYNAVAWAFPYDWFRYLSDVRTPKFRGAFGEGCYSKFSSMGNGSTFCIETLMFAAACWAVGSRKFLVYGDDVIVEKKYFRDFIRLTRFLGFTVNEDKSFADGPFRESCGGDYFNGIDVTPVYLRGVDSRKATLCHVVNTLASVALPGGELAKYLFNLCINEKLPRVPYQESTISGIWIYPGIARSLGTLRDKSYRCPGRKSRRRAWISECRVYLPQSKQREFVDSRGYYLWFLNKNSQVLFGGPWHIAKNMIFSQTSKVPLFQHKYVRKWVYWQPPVEGMPDHLHWWSELWKVRES